MTSSMSRQVLGAAGMSLSAAQESALDGFDLWAAINTPDASSTRKEVPTPFLIDTFDTSSPSSTTRLVKPKK